VLVNLFLHVNTKNMAKVRNSDLLSEKFKVSEIESRRTGHLDRNNSQLLPLLLHHAFRRITLIIKPTNTLT